MMLQKELIIGLATFVVSSVAMAANVAQPAQSALSSKLSPSVSHSTTQTQSNNTKAAQANENVNESVLTPGARLVSGEEDNEFYILDKNEPTPVKTHLVGEAIEKAINNASTPTATVANKENVQHANAAPDNSSVVADAEANTQESQTTKSVAVTPATEQTTDAMDANKVAKETAHHVHTSMKKAKNHHVAAKHSARMLVNKKTKQHWLSKVDQIEIIPHASLHQHVASKKTSVAVKTKHTKHRIAKRKVGAKTQLALKRTHHAKVIKMV